MKRLTNEGIELLCIDTTTGKPTVIAKESGEYKVLHSYEGGIGQLRQEMTAYMPPEKRCTSWQKTYLFLATPEGQFRPFTPKEHHQLNS